MKFNKAALAVLCLINLSAMAQEMVYNSESLKIEQLTEHVYRHISYLNTEAWGKVECNGMIVMEGGEALVFDTPVGSPSGKELINWVVQKGASVKAVVATHFHYDCLGELDAFHDAGVPSYGSHRTISLAKSIDNPVPQVGFADSLLMTAGRLEIIIQYYGEGHTTDNVVVYVPEAETIFGGCLVKAMGAGKGNLEDANTKAWPFTMEKIVKELPNLRLVIPGHGQPGGVELLEYTARMFREK